MCEVQDLIEKLKKKSFTLFLSGKKGDSRFRQANSKVEYKQAK